jgi:arginine utilization protein RocB
MNITKETATSKTQILQYFRDRSTEFLSEVNVEFGNTEYKKKVTSLNTLLIQANVRIQTKVNFS